MIDQVLQLFIGMALVLFGLQIFFDVDRRKGASEMVKAAVLVTTGLFFTLGYIIEYPPDFRNMNG